MRPRFNIKMALAAAFLVVVWAGWYDTFQQVDLRAVSKAVIPETPSQILFSAALDNNTLNVERESIVTLHGAGASLPRNSTVHVNIAALGFDTNVSSAQLEAGVPIRLTPSHAGIFQMKVEANREIISTIPVFVTSGPELGTSDRTIFSVAKSPAILNGGNFQVPIMVWANEWRDESRSVLVPEVLTVDTSVRVVDKKGQINPLKVTIQKGNTASDPIRIPISLQSQYCLALDGVSSDTDKCVSIDWTNDVPPMQLEVIATRRKTYATTLTPVDVTVWLTCRGDLVPLSAFPPPICQGDAPLLINELLSGAVTSNAIRTFRISSSTGIKNAKINILYPQLNLAQAVQVTFVSPFLLLGVAFLFGLGGVVLARFNAFAAMWAGRGYARVLLDIICTALCAVLLYAAVLIRFIDIKLDGTMLVGTLPALVFGLIGGFMGTGIFNLLIKVLHFDKGHKANPPDNPNSFPST